MVDPISLIKTTIMEETLKLIQQLKDDVEVTLDDLEFVKSKIDSGELEVLRYA